MPQPPFIIWTLQRTGGTNLAHQLMRYHDRRQGLHEPFLHGRPYGAITEQWEANADRAELRRAVAQICGDGGLIKHCIDTAPLPITAALLRASCRAGYRHLLLYRRSALDRLLSLHFARRTGIWSANGRAPDAECSDSIDDTLGNSLPVDALVEHERMCIRRLDQCWSSLRWFGAQPYALAFEDIYEPAIGHDAIALLVSALGALRMGRGAALDTHWAMAAAAGGGQATRHLYQQFPGVAELTTELKRVRPFHP